MLKQQITHVCDFCGKEFTSNHKEVKFCSRSCKDKYKRRKEPKYCLTCGKEIEIKGAIKYCSDECREITKKKQLDSYKEIKVCEYCQKEYKTPNKEQKYCSQGCSSLGNRTHNFICKHCGKKFYVKYLRGKNDSRKYCSFECYLSDIEIKQVKEILSICPVCGKEFERAKRKKYCSQKCKKKQNNLYYRSKVNLGVKIIAICKNCGKELDNKFKDYCSSECQKEYNSRKPRIKNKNEKNGIGLCRKIRRARLKLNGPIDKSITLDKLINRDKGICHICGQKVSKNTSPQSAEYPSIDHLIPVSKGGTHTWNNIKLAHRGCNTFKSNNLSRAESDGQFALYF